ncbi:MAG: hypothetical protein IJW05_09435 [Lentisphaeria bacterium]|nr:hypothetical protein [Lentisphaeria bacterium]
MKFVFALLCSLVTVTLFAADPAPAAAAPAQPSAEEQLAQLEQDRQKTRDQLIAKRVAEIKADKRLAKIANEILRLNQELADYLNTKPEIRALNMRLIRLDRKIRELKALMEEQKQAAPAQPAGENKGTN